MTTSDPLQHAASDALPPVAGPGAPGHAPLIHGDAAGDLPTSFGVFKPVGHVMTGLPTQAQVNTLVGALHDAGWPASGVRQFSPRESVEELRAMVDKAGPLAGLGYEITLLRRYLALTEQGCRWLLVQADDNGQAARVADVARQCGATIAVHYRTLTVEELIP